MGRHGLCVRIKRLERRSVVDPHGCPGGCMLGLYDPADAIEGGRVRATCPRCQRVVHEPCKLISRELYDML